MKARKAKDLVGLSDTELQSFVKESEENVMRLRFQLALGQLQDSSSIKTLRKDIARMKTIIHERTRNAN
ncbi:MAG: 50S ribosomal protein L29 [Ignavibacteria bacterium]|nr:50S ribosomal protein L29 [Ignavibacteria bacterium]